MSLVLLLAMGGATVSACGSAGSPLFVRDSAAAPGNVKFLVSGGGTNYIVQCDREGPGAALERCRHLKLTFTGEEGR